MIFAYENKLKDKFIPNGVSIEEAEDTKKYYDVTTERQYFEAFFENVLKFQGTKIEKMNVDDANNSGKFFYIPFETLAHPTLWLGHTSKNGKELFSHLSDKALESVRNDKAKIIIFSGYEGSDGNAIPLLSVTFYYQCLKYNIPHKNVIYITSNLRFKQQYIDWNNHCFGNKTMVTVYCIPYFWEIVKFLFDSIRYDSRQLADISHIDKKKKYRYLCFNKAPRGHRYIIASHLLYKHKERGLLSMPNWEHDDHKGHWNHWTELIDSRFEKMIMKIDNLKKSVPLVIDKEYEVYTESADVSYLSNSWTYTETGFSIITETEFNHKPVFLTEKTFKAIVNFHPFIIAGNTHSLKFLKSFGFKTFHPYINEDYDNIKDDTDRLYFILNEIDRLCNMHENEFEEVMYNIKNRVIYNYNHFWNNGEYIRKILERENVTI